MTSRIPSQIGLTPASLLPAGIHPGCGKPLGVGQREFMRWWMTPRLNPDGSENRFVPLRMFLGAYCLCRYDW
jgi:hypothetical protein